MAKKVIKAQSESAMPNGSDYPKQVTIIVDIKPDDPDRILVSRVVENLSGLELYGLLLVVTKAVEDQVSFPLSQRSDGITVSRSAVTKDE